MITTSSNFIEKVASYVKKYAPKHGICVYSPIVAQAVLESGHGRSELAVNANNILGIKYKPGRCPTASGVYTKVGSEQNADGTYTSSEMIWCKFDSIEDCVIGYFEFISHIRYSGLKNVTDPRTYLETIKAANYATSLSYVDDVMNVIEKYDLTKYDIVVKEETEMATKKIALDAGHGLKTAGKQTPDGIKEWTLNDKVRDKIVVLLKDYDVEFVFTDNDEGIKDEGLVARRTMYINEKVDAAVSIHHNAYKGTWCSATGVGVFVDKKATDADLKLANLIQTKLPGYTGLKSRGVKRANFTVIYQNTVPAVLVEGGFMDNKKDHAVITSDAGQTAYAKAVAEALIEFLNLKKKTANNSTPTSDKTTNNAVLYRVQTGAFRNKAYADAEYAKVKKVGFAPCIVKSGNLYKIQVGAYKKKTNADNMAKKLEAKGFKTVITTNGGSTVAVSATKSIDEIAREVIKGEWGSGSDRKNRLTKAGYDYEAVQKKVNELL